MKLTTRALRLTLWIALLLSACAAPPESAPSFPTFVLVTRDPQALPTPTPFQPSSNLSTSIPSYTPAPLTTDTLTPNATPQPSPTFTSQPTFTAQPAVNTAAPQTPSANARTNYIFYATLDFTKHTLAVDETIRYYNTTGAALTDLLLSVQPNRYGGSVFVLNSISQDSVALDSYSLNGQSLTLTLPQPLQPNAATTLTLNFNLNLPSKSAEGLFGYDFNQINLVDWYPFVVPYNKGWILHDPMPFGEHLVYDASDIEVNLKTDANVVVAASAPAESNGEWTRYRLYGARTFTLSASDEFLVSESAVGAVQIRSYYFDGYKAAGESILYSAVQAVSLYSAKFADYPYQTLAIVQADIHDGQEYDGLIFLASDFYSQYGGGARNNLTTIGVHEIAHQWWFGLVGDDQALEPWLDEALSAYTERIFYEYNYPRYGDWWWQYRVDYFGAQGYVDSSIYDWGSQRAYVNAVYLNGAHFMEDLRVRMGDDAFFRFLKAYAAQYAHQRASGADFFALARANTSADLSDLIAKYFAGSY
ncbi:MAG: hypothetical protein IT310_07825 [Anaerolineales bacterium]|nr:hypothetical protein [Anaerolineales bacterium]